MIIAIMSSNQRNREEEGIQTEKNQQKNNMDWSKYASCII
jgi:hypothetical protein